MWSVDRTGLQRGRSEQGAVFRDGRRASFAEVVVGWKNDSDFCGLFGRALAAADLPAFFWETPPVRRDRMDIPYEHVLVRSDVLAGMRPDRHAFAEEFASSDAPVAAFRNLGGDALLVAPRQIGDARCYAHFALFLRGAPHDQITALFRELARSLEQELQRTPEPIWVSTSGLGVAWLHIRLDSRPKYYQYRPYADR